MTNFLRILAFTVAIAIVFAGFILQLYGSASLISKALQRPCLQLIEKILEFELLCGEKHICVRAMGWQSYIIDVHEIRKRILVLEAIKRHNNEPFDGGEDVIGIGYAIHDETKRLNIVFGNGGGRSSTFQFFDDFNIQFFDDYDSFKPGRGIDEVDIEIERLQQEGNTNLMTFIDDENFFMKAALLESGVEIEAVNSLGSTALLCCAEEGRLILMKILLQNVPKANMNAADKAGWTALHYSAWRGQKDGVRLLLSEGAMIDAVNKHGQTAMEVASGHAKLYLTYVSQVGVQNIESFWDKYDDDGPYRKFTERYARTGKYDHNDDRKSASNEKSSSVIITEGYGTSYLHNDSNNCCIETIQTVLFIEPIFSILQEFLSYESINSLLNATSLLKNLKKTKFYWKLNRDSSRKYYHDQIYRLSVDSLIGNVNGQLSLDVSFSEEIVDVSVLGNVNALCLRGCYGVTDVSSLGKVQTLDLRKCNTDMFYFSALGSVQNLFWHDAHNGDIYDGYNSNDDDEDEFYSETEDDDDDDEEDDSDDNESRSGDNVIDANGNSH